MQLAKEDEDCQKIKIEIFGIEPLEEISVFDKIFEKINTLLLNKTIDKFSEKFLKPVEVSRAQVAIRVPFLLNDKDLKYVYKNSKKLYLVFPVDQFEEKFYFMQILLNLMQSFLVPAETADQSVAKTNDSKTPEINSRSPKLKFGSMALQRQIKVKKDFSSDSSKYLQSIKSALLPTTKKKMSGLLNRGFQFIDFEVEETSEKSEEQTAT